MIAQNLKYPIGKFIKPPNISTAILENWIEIIKSFPEAIKSETETKSDTFLDTPYREGGWTVRQVVHHCADSHMHAFIRFKLALTEDNPIIKPYNEALWAELYDSKFLPIQSSLTILEGVHYRWYMLLKNLDKFLLKRNYIHPEHTTAYTLEEAIGMYAWHCKHHLAHIQLVSSIANLK